MCNNVLVTFITITRDFINYFHFIIVIVRCNKLLLLYHYICFIFYNYFLIYLLDFLGFKYLEICGLKDVKLY